MPLALIPRVLTTALAILPILEMVLYVKVSFIFRLRNLIMYVLLNVTKEHAELVTQIFDMRKQKSLSPNTPRNYCHSLTRCEL